MLNTLYQTICRLYIYRLIAREINSFGRYFTSFSQILPMGNDDLVLFNACFGKEKSVCRSLDGLPDAEERSPHNRLLLLNGNCNHSLDIEGLLRQVRRKLSRQDRLVVVFYNPYLRWLFVLTNRLRIRKGNVPTTFCTRKDIRNIDRLAGFEMVRERPVGYLPFSLFGLGTLLNSILQAIPVVRWLGVVDVIVLRPVVPSSRPPSLSIVIPARNEKGNIADALLRLPDLSVPTEVIFVEGHSTDGTWEEIQLRMREYRGPFQLRAIQQTGKGKSDAVRLGFSLATNELLTILDADLTMPPEQLGRFYDAYVAGFGDFINGNRLVYPMEGEAMRFLNHLGNVFFAKLLSFVLQTDLGDSLCGTKLMSKQDYERFVAWRKDFGEFDPFGDFEIIFPACIMGLGVMEVPIHYRARTYGATNISRFHHGIILLKMSLIGLVRIRLGRIA
jgi:Glycosyl transferase family 2